MSQLCLGKCKIEVIFRVPHCPREMSKTMACMTECQNWGAEQQISNNG